MRHLILLICFLVMPLAHATTVVYVASSIYSPFQKVVQKYHLNLKLVTGSSSQLARQLMQGARADLYIAAHPSWTTAVSSELGLAEGYRFLSNRLVIVQPNSDEESALSAEEVLAGGGGRVAVADPSHVPAGIYTAQVSEYLGVEDSSAWIPARHSQHALRFVENKATPFGVVYYSDAINSSKVRISHLLPQHAHSPIVYVLLPITEKGASLSKQLLQEGFVEAFKDYGFLSL